MIMHRITGQIREYTCMGEIRRDVREKLRDFRETQETRYDHGESLEN